MTEGGVKKAWDTFVVREEPTGPGSKVFLFGTEHSGDDAVEFFDTAIRTATRHWVNLSGQEVRGSTLIVALEWFPDAEGNSVERARVAVNFSYNPTLRA